MNLGGLDWQRSKWSFFARKYLKVSEWFAVKFSGQIISDNVGIMEYLREEYGVISDVIPYGGDQAFKVIPENNDLEKYDFLSSPYAFSVARIQSDNNIELLLESFDENSPYSFVFVGNWNNSFYGKSIKEKYRNLPNLILIDAIYNQRELNLLRSNCFIYLHGHSAGGTNPALVEAMNLGLTVFAFDNNFNRYTTDNKAFYFKDSFSLKILLSNITPESATANSNSMLELGKSRYVWDKVCNGYATIFNRSI